MVKHNRLILSQVNKMTYKSREVIVDSLRREPLSELPLFPHQFLLHLLNLLLRALPVVACHGRIRGLFEFPLRADKQFRVHLLGRDHVTWERQDKRECDDLMEQQMHKI